jgi:broad specificity phosphatase PhoE
MTRVFLIRHGETDWNRDGICMGQLDIPLNERGKRQAELAAERLSGESIDVIYASDLSRALETAQMIAARHGLEPIVRRDLRELHYGHWQGYTREEVEVLYPEAYSVSATDMGFRPKAGESRLELHERALRAFHEIVEKHSGQTVAIVAHGGVIRSVVNHILQEGSEQGKGIFFSWGFLCSNCGITLIEESEEGRLQIRTLNDLCHLASLDVS